MSRKKTTIWGIGHVYFGTLLGFVRGFVLVPLYLTFIESDLFGAWLATGNILMWLTVVDPGVGDVATQKVAVSLASKDFKRIELQMGASILISSLISAFVLLIGWVSSDFLLDFIGLGAIEAYESLSTAFRWSVVNLAFTLLYYATTGILSGLQLVKQRGFIFNISRSLGIGLTFLLLYQGYGLMAIVYGNLFITAGILIFQSLLVLQYCRKNKLAPRVDLHFTRQYGRLFGFTFLEKTANTIASNLDLVIISKFIGLDTVTAYELTKRPMKFIKGIVTTPSIAMLPTVSHLVGSNDRKKLGQVLAHSSKLFFFLLIVTSLGILALNGSFISIWVGSEYYIGDTFNLLLCAYFFTNTSAYVFFNFSFSMGLIKQVSLFELFKNGIYLLFLVLGVKYFGLLGLLAATLLTSLLSEFWFYPFLLGKQFSLRPAQLGSTWWRMAVFLILGLMVAWLVYSIPVGSWFSLGWQAGLIILLMSLTFFYLFNDTFAFVRKSFLKRI